MILFYLLPVLGIFIADALGWLPIVTALPTVHGIDLDTTLIQMVSYFNSFIDSFWMIGDVWYGALFLLLYYILKNIVLRLILGSRAGPSH